MIGVQMIIKKKIKGITQMIMKTTQMMIEGFNKPDIHEAYNKCIYVIMKCRTEEQLRNAERYLRHYERLMQNSYLYPSLTKSFKRRTTRRLLSILKIKSKDFKDL